MQRPKWLETIYRTVARGAMHTIADLMQQVGTELHTYANQMDTEPEEEGPIKDDKAKDAEVTPIG